MSYAKSTAAILWHAITADEALQRLETTAEGLATREAARRLALNGPNRLPPPKRRTPLVRFLLQFHNVLIYVLLASAMITLAMGHLADTSVILGVVVINAVVGYLQEGKAERALDAIRRLLSPQAIVLRSGQRITVDAETLVPGDIVLVQAGDKVPADLRLLRAHGLQAEEAALTGESVPVDKGTAPVPARAVVAERFSLAFSGTLITHGQGMGVVVATGRDTELGRISALLARIAPLETPLLRQISIFGRWLTFAIVVLAVLTFFLGVMVRGYAADAMFIAAVSLAVAAIPEGLPAVITITLALGVQRMARHNAIVRRLPAVETLGSVTVICTDKTGTLTRNEMTVQSVATSSSEYAVGGVGYDPHGGFSIGGQEIAPESDPVLLEICRVGALCNDSRLERREERWQVQGDPTEGALLALARKSGIDTETIEEHYPRTDVIPFDSEHRFMATLHHDHAGHKFVLLKGAPERVLDICVRERANGEDVPVDVAYWHAFVHEFASRGQRVLALAFRQAGAGLTSLTFADVEGGFTLLGLTGLIDPPRPEAVEAVARCRRAGIRVKMITGDHAVTARAVGAQMGIGDGTHALTGHEFETLNDAALRKSVVATDVFARASPEHKLRIVEALQAEGHVIAMTGDGVNDAPALRRANVGVAMGVNGTEVAKEAAEMVLADDNFATIAHAVEEGRTIYENIKKSILFILPTNGGEALTVIAAVLLGIALPITPLQILWVNMITAVTLALALAFEPTEPDTMDRPPRAAGEPLLTGFLTWRIAFVSVALVAGTFGLFLYEEARGVPLDEARTVAVNTLVVFEVFYLFSTRFIMRPIFTWQGLVGNPYVLLTSGLVISFQLLFTYAPPMQKLFETVAIGPVSWGRIFLASTAVLLLVEAEKWVWRILRR